MLNDLEVRPFPEQETVLVGDLGSRYRSDYLGFAKRPGCLIYNRLMAHFCCDRSWIRISARFLDGSNRCLR